MYRIKNMENDSLHNLWLAVIQQAFFDIKTKNKKKELLKFRLQVISWFDLKNEDFILVCKMANCCPVFVYKLFERFR